MGQNTIEILSSINKLVTQIAQNTAPQNKNSETTLKKINQGATATPKPSGGMGVDISVASIGGIASALATLPPIVKKIAGLSGSTTKKFTSVINGVISVTQKLDEAASKSNKSTLKYLTNLTKVMDSVHKVLKKMSTVTLLAPLALLGIIVSIPVFIAFNLLMKIVSIVAVSAKAANKLKEASKGVNEMIGFMFRAAALAIICLGMGMLIMSGDTGKLIVGGLIAFGAVILVTLAVMALTGVAALLVDTVAMPGLKDMMKLVFGMVLLTAVLFGFGALLMMGNTKKLIMGGLLAFGATMLVMLSVILLTGLASKLVTNKDGVGSLVKMMIFTFAAMVYIVACKFLADFVNSNWKDILIGIGATTAVMLSMIGLAKLASKLEKDAVKGTLAVGIVLGLAFITMGFIKLALSLSEEAKGKWGQISLTILGIVGVITVFGALAFAASYIAGPVALGSLALLAIVPFVLGATFMVKKIIDFHLEKEQSGVDWGDVYTNVAAISGVVGIFAVVASAMSFALVPIALGTVAILPLTLFVSGAIGIVQKMAAFSAVSKESGVSWKTMKGDVGLIGKVIGAFALLSGAMTLALVPATLGLLAIVPLKSFVDKSVSMVMSVAKLAIAIKEAGGGNVLVNTVNKDMKRVIGSFTESNLDIPLSIFDIIELSAKYRAVSVLVSSFASTALNLCKIASVMGMVDDQGRISPLLGNDADGNPIYGEPVDLVKVSALIVNAVKTFVSGMDGGFTDVKSMMKSAMTMTILGSITTPITKFIEMLTGYESGGDGILVPVYIDEQGNVTKGAQCNVAVVAQTIVGAVNAFLSALYAPDVLSTWSEYVYGDKEWWQRTNTKTKALKEVAGVLGMIVEPINGLISLLTGFESSGEGLLNSVYIENGEVKKGPVVDVKNTAKSICDAVTSFAQVLFGENLTTVKSEDVTPVFECVEKVVSIGKQISDQSLNAELITTNSNALGSMLGQVFNPMTAVSDNWTKIRTNLLQMVNSVTGVTEVADKVIKLDAVKLTNNTKVISDCITNVYDNSLSAVSPKVIDFVKNSNMLSSSINRFDDALMRDADKRKKAIDEFKDSITELLEKFSGASESIHELYSLVRYLETMDSNKISANVSSINVTRSGSPAPAAQSASYGSGGSPERTREPQMKIDDLIKGLTSAIRNAMDGATLTATTNVVMDDPDNPFTPLVSAMNTGYSLSLNQ